MNSTVFSFQNYNTPGAQYVRPLWLILACVPLLPLVLNFLTSPVKSLPGPFVAKFTNVWRLGVVWSRSSEKQLYDLHEQYGPVVALGPNMVSVNDPQLIKSIYSRKDIFIKSDFYAVNDFTVNGRRVENVFSTRDEEMNGRAMKHPLRLLCMTNLLRYEALVDKTIAFFLEQFDKRFVGENVMSISCDMDNWLYYFASDVVGELTYNKRMGFLDRGEDVNELRRISASATDYFAVIGQMPFLDYLFDKNPLYRLGPLLWDPIIIIAMQAVAARRASTDNHDATTRPDFLDAYLEIQRQDPENITEDVMVSYMMTNVVAGVDTIASGLRGIIYHLSQSRRVLQKLQAELNAADFEGPLSWSMAQKLPYLEACVKEGWRLSPSVPLPLERVVGGNGLRLSDGKLLSPGTIVGINPHVMNRHKGVYGSDADSFRPERWLRAKNEDEQAYAARLSLMNETDMTFGAGKRMCPGRSLAMLETYKVVGTLCKVFDFERIGVEQGGREWRTVNSWFMRQEGLDLRLWRRG